MARRAPTPGLTDHVGVGELHEERGVIGAVERHDALLRQHPDREVHLPKHG
jgi:hypothetical protein